MFKFALLNSLGSLGILLFAGSTLAQTPITVNNFSFETPSQGSPGSGNGNSGCPTSWTCSPGPSGGQSQFNPGGYTQPGTANNYPNGVTTTTFPQGVPSGATASGQPVPNGTQAYYLDGNQGAASISQNTAVSLQPDTIYTLSVWLGTQKYTLGGGTGTTSPGGTLELTAGVTDGNGISGGVVLASSPEEYPAYETWYDYTLTYTTGATIPGADSGLLGISILEDAATHAELQIDDVTLTEQSYTPTPETNTILLFGTGMLFIGSILRKKHAA